MMYSRERLIGKWHRHDIDEQGNQISEYADVSVDGCFEFTFIYHNSVGEVTHQCIELGDWGLVGDIHFTITKSEFFEEQHYAADLNDADNYNAYRVLELTGQTFKYQHVVSNEIFVSRRLVSDAGNC